MTRILGVSTSSVARSAAFMSSLNTSSLSVFRVVVKVRRRCSVRLSGRSIRRVRAINSTIRTVQAVGWGYGYPTI